MNDILQAVSLLEQLYYKIIKVNTITLECVTIKLADKEKTYNPNILTWAMDFVAGGNVCGEDINDFMMFFSTPFHEGKNFYYRRKLEDGFHWVHMEIKQCANSEEVMLFVRNCDNDFISKFNKQKELEYKINHDPLTDLNNRAAYNHCISIIKESNVGVLYCDLNKLKHYNDTYGHERGDQYIINFANTLRQIFRFDNCYRIGGDEFVVICPNIEEEKFQQKIISLCQLCINRNLSCAIGNVWTEYLDSNTIKSAIQAAQSKMYLNKVGHNLTF